MIRALMLPHRPAAHARGFTLIELMVAVVLGILLSIGLVTLFGATSKTSRVQNAMAQMQENGRFAVQRMSYDLRMASRQIVNTTGYATGTAGIDGVVGWSNAPSVYWSGTILFPDMTTPIGPPTSPAWPAGFASWPLSPRWFYQGYECSGGSCSPAEPASSGVKLTIPASGTTLGSRVPKSDVLVMRYLNGDGLSLLNNDFTVDCGGTAGIVTVTLSAAAAATSNIQNNDLVMLTSSSFGGIFQVARAGQTLTPINTYNAGIVPCIGSAGGQIEASLFNFSRDFVTVAYWLQLTADANDATHLIPSLFRAQGDNSGAAATTLELVQGVDQLDFLYGIQDATGKVAYADAGQVTTNTLTCSSAPAQFSNGTGAAFNSYLEPGCMWRAIKSIEVHLLVNSVTNMYDLTQQDLTYRYNSGYSASSIVYDGSTAPPSTMPSGLPFGSVLRREFVALTSQRNFNP